MKQVVKHSKKVFIMVALLATVMGYANEPSFFYIRNDVSRTILTLTYVKEGNLLTIKDDNGITLYKEPIEATGVYTKEFDLTSLPDGNYVFELDKDLEIRTVPFKVATSVVTFDKSKETVSFKPYVWMKKDKVFVSKLALNLEPMDVAIYYEGRDSNGFELISSEAITGEQTIRRVYKLDGTREGNYKVVCTSEDRTFTETFKM